MNQITLTIISYFIFFFILNFSQSKSHWHCARFGENIVGRFLVLFVSNRFVFLSCFFELISCFLYSSSFFRLYCITIFSVVSQKHMINCLNWYFRHRYRITDNGFYVIAAVFKNRTQYFIYNVSLFFVYTTFIWCFLGFNFPVPVCYGSNLKRKLVLCCLKREYMVFTLQYYQL